MAALLNDNQAVHHFIANKLSPNIELQLSSYVVRYWMSLIVMLGKVTLLHIRIIRKFNKL